MGMCIGMCRDMCMDLFTDMCTCTNFTNLSTYMCVRRFEVGMAYTQVPNSV